MIDSREINRVCDSCGEMKCLDKLAHPSSWSRSMDVVAKITLSENTHLICRSCFIKTYIKDEE